MDAASSPRSVAWPAMADWRPPTPSQLRRLIEELDEVGLRLDGTRTWHATAADEIAYAIHPRVHERYVPSYGSIIEPTSDPETWERQTGLGIKRWLVGHRGDGTARRYADGVASWLLRRPDGDDEWLALDRQAGSERDLVVLASAMRAVVVHRHPTGKVRVVGDFGVFRWEGLGWRHEPTVDRWIDELCDDCDTDRPVLRRLLEFAVHDLGARGIGALLVHEPDLGMATGIERRLPAPPALTITRPLSLAPLRHAIAQTDGAVLFDADGTLIELGVRLVPSFEAEVGVDGFRGMRHTSARRYSYDDPGATVIVVSEDGPVTVFRGGEIAGTAATTADEQDAPS